MLAVVTRADGVLIPIDSEDQICRGAAREDRPGEATAAGVGSEVKAGNRRLRRAAGTAAMSVLFVIGCWRSLPPTSDAAANSQ
jgi:hypothetical protein